VEIVEIEVPQLLVGRKVSELTVPGEMTVSAITRENKSFIPTLGTEFKQRDMVTLSVDTSSSKRLKSLLGLA
jgi:trk system potassium uptake protein TrkA